MIIAITNEQGLLEVEAHVELTDEGGRTVAEVVDVWIEGERIAPGRLPLELLEELEQQALEEV